MEESFEVALTVNGTHRTARVPARRLLSDLLRHDLGLTGTHVGCEHGVCGCCTILLDGEPVRSCLMFAVTAAGHEVTTVEGSPPRTGRRRRCSARSANATACNAASAHPVSSARSPRCCGDAATDRGPGP